MEQWERDLTDILNRKDDSGDDDLDDDDLDDDDLDDDDLDEENGRLVEKLSRVADILADKGIIHNTPACKYNWINGN
jgi:hypothetical protein